MRMIQDSTERTRWLEHCGIAEILPPTALEQLELCCFERGESLCTEEDSSPYLFFILCGRYKLTRLTVAGQECLLRFFDAFSLIGELELLYNGPARTNAIAVEPLICLRLPCNRWRAVLLDHNPFLRFLCGYLGYKTVQRSQNLTLRLSASVSQRAASYILATARDGLFLDNHLHLAEFLSCSHRQLLRAIAGFCQDGLLRREPGGGYRILDAKALRAASGGVYAADPFCYPGLRPGAPSGE